MWEVTRKKSPKGEVREVRWDPIEKDYSQSKKKESLINIPKRSNKWLKVDIVKSDIDNNKF